MKTVMIYVTDSIDLILTKSNAWYLRHYEGYFDKVYVVFLRGNRREPIVQGRTSLVCLGTGRSKLDFLAAPIHLYKFARKIRPSAYVTSDQIWSWWISSVIQLFLGAKIYLMPQFMPEQIYKTSKRSVSIVFPIWLERILIRLSFLSADRMLTGLCFGSVAQWLHSLPTTRDKTIVARTLPEALPPPAFLERVEGLKSKLGSSQDGPETKFQLIYVGRLQHQKMVDGLIRMMSLIMAQKDLSRSVELTLIGDGPERQELEKLVDDLNLRPFVNFIGHLPNEELPDYLLQSHVFVSPLTGMSLREAAVCGMPVVAYDMDWIHGLLKHEVTALLVAPGDHQEMGRQVLRLMADEALSRRLSRNIKELAERMWSSAGLYESLQQVFEADQQTQQA